MTLVTAEELLQAGVHFGHRVSRWNPKMKKYIFGKRNLIHIINLKETIRGLIRAANFLTTVASEGGTILFAGTKRQARNLIVGEARRCNMPYVHERWLGGTLTNFNTIISRIARLEELENMEFDGSMELYSKKELASFNREKRRMRRNLDGIRTLKSLPACIIIVDPKREHIAIREAARLSIPSIAIIDTDCDPDMVDIPIPGNDDAFRSINTLLSKLTDAIITGRAVMKERMAAEEKRKAEEELKRKDEAKRLKERHEARLRADADRKKKDEMKKAAAKVAEKTAANKEKKPEEAPKADAPKADTPKAEAPKAEVSAEQPAEKKVAENAADPKGGAADGD